VARRKQESSRLPLSLFVDAPRERNDLGASAPSALASYFDNRAYACKLVALAHGLLLSVSPVPHRCQLDQLTVSEREQRSCSRARHSPYAAFSAPPGRSFGHGSQRLRRLVVPGAGEGDQRGCGKRGFLDGRLWIFFQVALKPSRCDSRVAARLCPRDQQRQLERVYEAELRQVPRNGQGRDDVPALECLLEDSVRAAL